jgi:DNA-binding transcriptional MerR regulator
MQALLRCGEVARRCGVSPDTVRHYERLGLIPAAARTSAGYRQYPVAACRRVRVVRTALGLGFTLRELAGVMAIRDGGGAPCQKVRRLAESRLKQIEMEIHERLQLRRRLKAVMKDWDLRLSGSPRDQRAHLLETLVPED